MDSMKKGWFSELNDLWPGVSLSLEVKEILHTETSRFQNIMVVDTKSHGRALILDGIIQCTQNDEFSYQEMISFLPLCCHPNPRKVLIVGGGDGGVAREVVKHPSVEQVELVEIDEAVISASKRHLPDMAVGFANPKLTVSIEDGFKFMSRRTGEFDVIITDSSDPVGPAVSLFERKYFELMRDALSPGGIVCSQGGTPWANLSSVAETMKICQQVFPVAAFGYTSVPTYPTGQIGFIMGSINKATEFNEPVRVFSEDELDNMKLRYYSPEVHRAAFALPRFAKKALYG
ncbi:hypothetical protein AAG570_006196 [Ranatra chinensis]|uniref:PABS domain-containing protein n=1 Tax=Ranatra chinensis TaxID=642074 RepID=A0ABD0XXC5_9HEMI